jgi:hypothetical protein
MSGGTVVVTGAVTVSGGTLVASGIGGSILIASGAVVSGGAITIGNGIVDIQSGGSANVAFLANGSGGLEIADTQTNPEAYTGVVSGFGGAFHTNHTQFIDLISVPFGAGMTLSYPVNSANTSGTLTVSSGGHLVASIGMIGTYSAGNFHIKSGISGTVEITDPHVLNGGTVEAQIHNAFEGENSTRLPYLAFNPLTVLAGPKNNNRTDTGSWFGDPYAAKIGVLASYMAGTFAAPIDGHGCTMIHDGIQTTGQQMPLAIPHNG